MPERKHHLPSRFSRLDDQITGPVADAIAVRPGSHGRLYLPGEWSTTSRPPCHEVTVTSSDPDNQGIYTEECLAGRAERYAVTYDVWNYRDSPAVAQIILTGQASSTPPDTPGGLNGAARAAVSAPGRPPARGEVPRACSGAALPVRAPGSFRRKASDQPGGAWLVTRAAADVRLGRRRAPASGPGPS